MRRINFLPKQFSNRPEFIQIAVNVCWLFFDKILKMVVGLFVVVWMARYLGPEKFGLLNYVVAFTSLFLVISILGLKEIVVRDIVQDPTTARVTLGTAVFLQLLAGIVAYFLMVTSLVFFSPDDGLAISLAVIIGATLTLKFSDTVAYWFEAQVLSKYTVWVQNVAFMIFAMVKIILIIREATLVSFAWAMLLEAALTSILLIILMGRKGISLAYLRFDLQRARELLKDSWPLIISAISVTVYMRIDQIMLGQMIGDEAVGIYSAAVRISAVWYFIPMAICASVFPALLELKKRSEAEYYVKLQILFDAMFIISLVIAVPITFMATPIVTLIYGESYLGSAPVLTIHIWASVFVLFGVASSQWFIAQNRQILDLKRNVLGAVTNVLLNLWLVPKFQTTGAALATIVSYSISAFFADFLERETRHLFVMKLRSVIFFRLIKLGRKQP